MSCKLCQYTLKNPTTPKGNFLCIDCKKCTHCKNEYYMVNNSVWRSAGLNHGMLCLDCLEIRIGRSLKPADFINCPANKGVFRQSRKLRKLTQHLA